MQPTLRRNRVGTKASELWNWQVEDIKQMRGPLAVQQYIQELIRHDPSKVSKIIECPLQVDSNRWKYQQVRQLVLELNLLVTSLKNICNEQSCPTMKGSPETQFLCAAHKTPSNCSAISVNFDITECKKLSKSCVFKLEQKFRYDNSKIVSFVFTYLSLPFGNI